MDSVIQEAIRIEYEGWKVKMRGMSLKQKCKYTVRAPQVCSTMHNENTIDTPETISVRI
jgi:hypothetical protein